MSINKIIDFIRKLPRNYKVIAAWDALSRLADMDIRSRYQYLYIRAFGVDVVTLGSISSVASALSSIVSIPAGWLTDLWSQKKALLLGMILIITASFLFASATGWLFLLGGVTLLAIAGRMSYISGHNILINSLRDGERGTGVGLKNTISSFVGIFAPMLAAIIIINSGGISVQGIRPIFYIKVAGSILLTILIALKIKEIRTAKSFEARSFLRDFADLFNLKSPLKRYLTLYSFTRLSESILPTFQGLFLVEVKGADPLILGVMGTISMVTATILSAPLGRFADRFGRKKAIYLARPFRILSCFTMVFAPNAYFLYLAALFNAINMASVMTIWVTMNNEMVPPEYRGRWTGVRVTFQAIAGAVGPLIGGFLWAGIDPNSMFYFSVLVDLLIVFPLLTTIPETLKIKPWKDKQ